MIVERIVREVKVKVRSQYVVKLSEYEFNLLVSALSTVEHSNESEAYKDKVRSMYQELLNKIK